MDQLRAKLNKNRMMTRREAPITIKSTGFAKISIGMGKICLKIKGRK